MDLTPFIGLPDVVKIADPHRHTYSSYMERAIERLQLDDCILACDETVDYLYNEYTPTTTSYVPGTRPLLEAIVDQVCADCNTDREKAIALVNWRRANYRHVGKCGLGTEEEIILGGISMCHDASRTLITLCQVAGLGARMILGIDESTADGHTLTEVYVDGKWSLFDPSPCIAFPYYPRPDGTLANSWDIHNDPTIVTEGPAEWDDAPLAKRISGFFRDYRVVNYSLEESTRNMAQRFVRLVTAQSIVANYDYVGHLNHQPPSAYTDLDTIVAQWIKGTMEVHAEAEAKRDQSAVTS